MRSSASMSVQGAYTRKTQELAAQRAEIQSLVDLRGALGSEDEAARELALADFLAEHGYALETDLEPGEPAGGTAPPDELAELRSRLDARDEAEATAREDNAQRDQLRSQVEHAESALTELEGRIGELPEASKSSIVGIAASLARTENGLPDMGAAIEIWEADRAAAVEAYVRSKQAEPAPDLSGSSGAPLSSQPKTRAERLAKASQVAERVLASHA